MLHFKAEYMAATDYYTSRQSTIRQGLGPYMVQNIEQAS